MDPRIVNISRAVEDAARSGGDNSQILQHTRRAHPDASNAEIRRAAIYALTDPYKRDDKIKSRLHALAIEMR